MELPSVNGSPARDDRGMISTVAVGFDGSPTAGEAVKMAAEVARRFDAKLVLLSALREPAGARSGDETDWATNPAARVREMLARQRDDFTAAGLDCAVLTDDGDPGEVLVKLAEECGADVLVIGNKGMHRRVLGSVPNTVSHKATCAVLVVKTT